VSDGPVDGPTDRALHEPVEIPGPWQHRHVAANGARFHVAEAGPPHGSLVLLLHGFPEMWWAWRHQVPALAEAGHRVVAMDLRGYGGSDKTPNGYDPMTLAQDVSSVVKVLGARRAVLVGHGWGGYVGWATAAIHPREVAAVCVLSAPHPRSMLVQAWSGAAWPAVRHVLAMQLPMVPERRLASPRSGALVTHLRSWSGPGSDFPDEESLETYQRAIGLWPSSHCALEYHRWLFRSRIRADGRRFSSLLRAPVAVPVCTVVGDRDPAVPVAAMAASRGHVSGPVSEHVLAGVGHFPHEEDPAAVTALLLGWLAKRLPA
jgi:pimeloyl-ACP methyl ester carboxylesterase